ncbi:MAG: hypothetical protein HY040_26480 [Planctomycetes bacterium]|nr:hypothetical protein [Planctomycetota bacterium]
MEPTRTLIEAIHRCSTRCVLALTGGGSTASAQLLSVPGASSSILEVLVPYHPHALVEFLGHSPTQFCSATTSQEMAQRALDRARWLAPGEATLGLGCTASLASDRAKRGEHRIFVSTADYQAVRTWSLILLKAARERAEEEAVAAALVLHALARSLGLSHDVSLPLLPGEHVEEPAGADASIRLRHFEQHALFFAEDGQLQTETRWQPDRPVVLASGSFSPLHGGHWRLAEAASLLTGLPFAFELSRANVDKPELSEEEARRRVAQFAGRAPVWLTRAAQFVDKARLFSGAVFALGADTAARLVDARYYGGDEQAMLEALTTIGGLGCRFMVADRAVSTGIVSLADLPIPSAHQGLFAAIPPEVFRLDISSTELRTRGFF